MSRRITWKESNAFERKYRYSIYYVELFGQELLIRISCDLAILSFTPGAASSISFCDKRLARNFFVYEFMRSDTVHTNSPPA